MHTEKKKKLQGMHKTYPDWCGWLVECAGFISSDAYHHAGLPSAELHVQRHNVIKNGDNRRAQQRSDCSFAFLIYWVCCFFV